MDNRQQHKMNLQRIALQVNGIVQGVGFRPFVYTLATKLKLGGFIKNSPRGVELELQGPASAIDIFLNNLCNEPPPLAEINEIRASEITPLPGSSTFQIRHSSADAANKTLISPDMSICPDCLRELFDPGDRRYHYPFINCTNCGPRFTIIRSIPYDRPFTSMAEFTLCEKCKSEYEDPLNRRFHAQPNACPDCGPQVWLEDMAGRRLSNGTDDTFKTTVRQLLAGHTVAVKGLGGFHLVTLAGDETAVKRLRERKNREQKPLAIMLPDLEAVRKIALFSAEEEKLLLSPQRPIVLLKRCDDGQLAPSVAPDNQRLGVMLPYTPLHYLLFEYLKDERPDNLFPALVCTSANRSDEPIVIANTEARERLKTIADTCLLHNRDILIRSDDSVLFELNGKTQFLRRSRGYAPKAIELPDHGPAILALGAELKNTIAIARDNRVFVSQYIGDLENLTANTFFEETVEHMQDILTCTPEILIHDMHPDYFSSQWAQNRKDVKRITVQHHHAHMAAVMAEHKLNHPVVGLILDGTGYGYDGTIWGGEIFTGDLTSLERHAWLKPMPLPGGNAAIRQPWRTAIGYLIDEYGNQLPPLPILDGKPVDTIRQMIAQDLNCPLTSSCGRLFDAVAAILDIRYEVHYEAQAAIELTQLVKSVDVSPYALSAGLPELDTGALLRAVVDDKLKNTPTGIIAAKFHVSLAELLLNAIEQISSTTGIKDVVLSGGVFQNEVLLAHLLNRIPHSGMHVYTQHAFPVNDGSISLGQAVIGRALLTKKLEKVDYRQVVK